MGDEIVLGLRPEIFTMAADSDPRPTSHLTVSVDLVQAMGAEAPLGVDAASGAPLR